MPLDTCLLMGDPKHDPQIRAQPGTETEPQLIDNGQTRRTIEGDLYLVENLTSDESFTFCNRLYDRIIDLAIDLNSCAVECDRTPRTCKRMRNARIKGKQEEVEVLAIVHR